MPVQKFQSNCSLVNHHVVYFGKTKYHKLIIASLLREEPSHRLFVSKL